MSKLDISRTAVLMRRLGEVFENYDAEIKRERGEYQTKMVALAIFEFCVLVFAGLLLWNSISPMLELGAVMVISFIGLVLTIGTAMAMARFTKRHKFFQQRCETMVCEIINELFKEYYDDLWNALGTVHYNDVEKM